MAELDTQYYTGNDSYSDGDVEEFILKLVKEKKTLKDIPAIENRCDKFAILYHLSPIRENILNWYDFGSNSEALEIGAGCGAITGMLSRKCRYVTSVELSYRRALVNYYRNEECSNIRIVVGNFNQMNFQHQFDYVILNGVFEYAMSFTHSKEPYVDFLKGLKSFLKPTGKILIAIENRLGIKYFSGSSEDHTKEYFKGLNYYKGNSNVRTFSKMELMNLLERCGLNEATFYYPYPDYKFPIEIFSDETINQGGYGRKFYNFEDDKIKLWDDYAMMQTLAKEKIMDRFANSFLIETGALPAYNTDYVKINNERKKEFCIATKIITKNYKKSVLKFPLYPEGKDHIEKIMGNERLFETDKHKVLRGERQGNGIIYPFIKGKNFEKTLLELAENRELKNFTDSIKDFLDEYFSDSVICEDIYNEDFCRVFGTARLTQLVRCSKGTNIDIICDNVFKTEQGYIIIDAEWRFDFYIPDMFVAWRMLNELYYKNAWLEELIKWKDLLSSLEINEEQDYVYRLWANYFAAQYVSDSYLYKFEAPVNEINLNKIIENRYYFYPSLYIDRGDGYSEDTKIYKKALLQGNDFALEYELASLNEIKRLRFDPVEKEICRCEIIECRLGEKLIKLTPNYVSDEDPCLFWTWDPQFEVFVEEKMEGTLIIRGSIDILDKFAGIAIMEREQNKRLSEIDHLRKKYAEISEKLNGMPSEKEIQELLAKVKNLEDIKAANEEMMEELQAVITGKEKDIEQIQEEIREKEEKLNYLEKCIEEYRSRNVFERIFNK